MSDLRRSIRWVFSKTNCSLPSAMFVFVYLCSSFFRTQSLLMLSFPLVKYTFEQVLAISLSVQNVLQLELIVISRFSSDYYFQSKFSHDFSPTSRGQCKRTPDRGQQTTKGPDYGLVQATRARAKQINHFFVYFTGTPIGAYPLNQIS